MIDNVGLSISTAFPPEISYRNTLYESVAGVNHSATAPGAGVNFSLFASRAHGIRVKVLTLPQMAESRKHLLLVEDERPLREALAERVAEHGFDVEQAESGERALEQLAEFAFDI